MKEACRTKSAWIRVRLSCWIQIRIRTGSMCKKSIRYKFWEMMCGHGSKILSQRRKAPKKRRNALRENFSRKKLKSCTLGNPSHDNLGSEYVLLTKTTIGKSKIRKNLKICDEGHACLTPALNSGRVAVLTVTYVPQQVPILPKEDTPLSVRKGRSRVTQSASRLVQLLTRTANSLLNRWAGSWTKKIFFFLSDFQVKISKKGLRRFH